MPFSILSLNLEQIKWLARSLPVFYRRCLMIILNLILGNIWPAT
ncbi:Uncharacterized protein dnm_056820 [Desulfonema magnum]|uniref:Uncharacterized protein n=1 Tax=Desulfonema magnum TaxID=45655 RepID=A0A975BQ41_9BACT|nr:Uncharacterized protein dnm_056820 [Desulfonema magnum]